MNSLRYKAGIILVLIGMLLSACGTNLWGTYDPTLEPTSTSTVIVPTFPDPTSTKKVVPLSTTQAPTIQASPTVIPTIETVTPGTPRPEMIYYSQSGDSLEAVALHFGVETSEITSMENLPSTGLINPGTTLLIPNRLSQTATTPSRQIFPDSELVFGPSAQSFDIAEFISAAGGKLAAFREPRGNVVISGADLVKLMAFGSSISPRMLLAIIQYYTGWVQGQPNSGVDDSYPLGYRDPLYTGLYQQLRLVVRELLAGYYGWRDGSLTEITFPDGTTMRLDPILNAGSVALQYMFSKHLNYIDWLQSIDSETGFPALFTGMFGDPWIRAQETGPLFPPDMKQPTFTLPFEVGVLWSLTSGPHPAWEQESALAALDFAPAMDKPGCGESGTWVVAIASGLIVRSADGYVVLDLDGDGFEQTGWVVLYQHVSTKNRVSVGLWVNAGDHIGHPSCEGGMATGTHVHIARKYNGEWVSAGDPLPFILSGWTAHAGDQLRAGTLTKGNKTITASSVGSHESQIIRRPGE